MKKKAYRLKTRDFIIIGVFMLFAFIWAVCQMRPVQQSFYIYLLESGPPDMKRKAARKLQDYDSNDTVRTLLRFVRNLDYEKEREAAVSALTSLCLLSGETFGTDFTGTRHNNSIGYPETKEWPHIKENINDWAWEHGYKSESNPPQLSEDLKDLLNQLAGDDSKAAIKAWQDIGGRFQSSEPFLHAFKRQLGDPRPISFALIEEKARAPEPSRIFVAVSKSTPGAKMQTVAETVGESLRFHLYELEDACHNYSDLSFRDWWQLYCSQKDLPKAAAIWKRKEDPEY